jgi:hypothetical protein
MAFTPDILVRDLKVALRSRTKGLAITVALTLPLGIGANARGGCGVVSADRTRSPN